MIELNGRHFVEWNDLVFVIGCPSVFVKNIAKRAMKIPYDCIQDILETAEPRHCHLVAILHICVERSK